MASLIFGHLPQFKLRRPSFCFLSQVKLTDCFSETELHHNNVHMMTCQWGSVLVLCLPSFCKTLSCLSLPNIIIALLKNIFNLLYMKKCKINCFDPLWNISHKKWPICCKVTAVVSLVFFTVTCCGWVFLQSSSVFLGWPILTCWKNEYEAGADVLLILALCFLFGSVHQINTYGIAENMHLQNSSGLVSVSWNKPRNGIKRWG